LERCRLGVLVEGGAGGGQSDRVAAAGGELGEQRLERVAGFAGGVALGLRLARGRLRAACLGDRVGALGRLFVVEEQRLPGAAQVPAEVVGERAEEDVRLDAVLEPVVDRAQLERALSVRKPRSTSFSPKLTA
jgi:hypothetical protein